jgi:hypothetical protein
MKPCTGVHGTKGPKIENRYISIKVRQFRCLGGFLGRKTRITTSDLSRSMPNQTVYMQENPLSKLSDFDNLALNDFLFWYFGPKGTPRQGFITLFHRSILTGIDSLYVKNPMVQFCQKWALFLLR